MATTVLGLKTFTASDPVDYNEINDNYNKIDSGVKTAFQGRAAHNWLDNSNFANPIAQSGLNGMHGSAKYVCDRWISWDADATFGSGYITPGSPIDQHLSKTVVDINKTYTAAICLSDGTIKAESGTFSNGFGSYALGIYCMKQTDSSGYVTVRLNTGNNIRWAALYEGSYTAETLPAYQPKENELAECERYHVPIGSAVWMTGFFKVGEGLVVEIPAARNMRINNPTVVLNNPKAFTGTGWNDLTYRSFSISRHSAKIVFDFSDLSAAQASYGSAFLVIGIEAISADL